MQATCLLALLLVGLLAIPAAEAASVPLGFRAPAQFGNTGNATGLEWALLLFHGSTASLELDAHTESAVNHTSLFYGFMLANKTGATDLHPLPDRAASVAEHLKARLAFPLRGWSSLYLEADRIRLDHTDAEGSLLPLDAGESIGKLVPTAPSFSYHGTARQAAQDNAAFNLQGKQAFAFTLHATGLRRAEWSNAETHCETGCPDGARTQPIGSQPTLGTYATTLRVSFMDVATTDGAVSGAGTAWLAAAGGRSVDLNESGSIRLPLAYRNAECECADPGNRTLFLQGNVTLANLHPAGGDYLAADVSGSLDLARLDETLVPPALFGASRAVVAAGASALAGAAVLLGWLFSRVLEPRKALRHPKRRRIYEAVQAHPGVGPKALVHLTGLPRGTIRNHLKTLERVGLVVINRHARQTHYFENHGRYSNSWRSMAAARDGELRRLLDWLRNHPDSAQGDVVQQAHGWGLSRSAVQRRLDRLVAWNLLAVQRQGQVRRYRVI
ncbi:MAG: helix-turn-helix domain-containing protein [Halobacteriales archaeon]|nr:helix-turn-helix domain-containing protein [Halobacteriales archaeon]